jgi:hypothetical protein
MLQGVSWQEYFFCIAILAVVYYSFVVVLLGIKAGGFIQNNLLKARNSIGVNPTRSYPRSNTITQPRSQSRVQNQQETWTSQVPTVDDTVSHADCRLAQDLIDEVNAYFGANQTDVEKADLLVSLSVILKKYNPLKRTVLSDGIISLIVMKCQHNCSIRLREDEIREIWNAREE